MKARRFLERLAVGHFFGYPLAFLWAVASMPVAIHWNHEQLERIGDDQELMGQIILHVVAWPAGVVAVLSHLCAIGWGLSGDDSRGKYIYLGGFGVMLAIGVLFGAGSWIWLYLR
jgi:hypothetical protein